MYKTDPSARALLSLLCLLVHANKAWASLATPWRHSAKWILDASRAAAWHRFKLKLTLSTSPAFDSHEHTPRHSAWTNLLNRRSAHRWRHGGRPTTPVRASTNVLLDSPLNSLILFIFPMLCTRHGNHKLELRAVVYCSSLQPWWSHAAAYGRARARRLVGLTCGLLGAIKTDWRTL